MKRIAAILLSLVLLYGGVTWALGRCLTLGDGHEHASQEEGSHSHATASLDYSHDLFAPFFHCPTPDLRIEPAAQGGTARLKRTQRVSAGQLAWLYEPSQTSLRNGRQPDAVSRPDLVFSQAGGGGRHLLFSILQI